MVTKLNTAEGAALNVDVTTSNQGASGDVLTPNAFGGATIQARNGSWIVRDNRSYAFQLPDVPSGPVDQYEYLTPNANLYWNDAFSTGMAVRHEMYVLEPLAGDVWKQYEFTVASFNTVSAGTVAQLAKVNLYSTWAGGQGDLRLGYLSISDKSNTVYTTRFDIYDSEVLLFDFKVSTATGKCALNVYVGSPGGTDGSYSLVISTGEITGNFSVSGTPDIRTAVGIMGNNLNPGSGEYYYYGAYPKTWLTMTSIDSVKRSDQYAFQGTTGAQSVSGQVPATVGLVNSSIKQSYSTLGLAGFKVGLLDASEYGYLGSVVPNFVYTATPLTYGNSFTASRDCYSRSVRLYRVANTDRDAGLWEGDKLIAHVRVPAGDQGWVTVPWDSPVKITNGATYTVGHWIEAGFYPGTPSSSGVGAFSAVTSGRTSAGASLTKPLTTTSTTTFLIEALLTDNVPAGLRPGTRSWVQRSTIWANGNNNWMFASPSGGNTLVLFASYKGSGQITDIPGWYVTGRIEQPNANIVVYFRSNAVQGENTFTVTSSSAPALKGVVYEFPAGFITGSQVINYPQQPDSGGTTSISGMNTMYDAFFVVAHKLAAVAPTERLSIVSEPFREDYFVNDEVSFGVYHTRRGMPTATGTSKYNVDDGNSTSQVLLNVVPPTGSRSPVLPVTIDVVNTSVRSVSKTTGQLKIDGGLFSSGTPLTLFDVDDAGSGASDSLTTSPAVGNQLVASQDVWIYGTRFIRTNSYVNASANLVVEMGLWDSNGSLLASGWSVDDRTQTTGNVWRNLTFETPVLLRANGTYTVGMMNPTRTQGDFRIQAVLNDQSFRSRPPLSFSDNNSARQSSEDSSLGDYLRVPDEALTSLPAVDVLGRLTYPAPVAKPWVNGVAYPISWNGSTTRTIDFRPAAAGSRLILMVTSTASFTAPSGWTLSGTFDGTGVAMRTFTKVATASESSLSLNQASGASSNVAVYEFPAGTTIPGVSVGSNVGLSAPVTLTGTGVSNIVLAMESMPLTDSVDTPTTRWGSGVRDMASLASPYMSNPGVQTSIGLIDYATGSSTVIPSTTMSRTTTSRNMLAMAVTSPTTPVVSLPVTVGMTATAKTVLAAGTVSVPATVGLSATSQTIAKSAANVPVTVGLAALARTVAKTTASSGFNVGLSGIAVVVPIVSTTGTLSVSAGLSSSALQISRTTGSLPVAATVTAVVNVERITTATMPFSVDLTAVAEKLQTLYRQGAHSVSVGLIGAARTVLTTTGRLPVSGGLSATAATTQVSMSREIPIAVELVGTVHAAASPLPFQIDLTATAQTVLRARGELAIFADVEDDVTPVGIASGRLHVNVDPTAVGSSVGIGSGSHMLLVDVIADSWILTDAGVGVLAINTKPRASGYVYDGTRKVVSVSAKPTSGDNKNYARARVTTRKKGT